MSQPGDAPPHPVLVLAPTGRDAEMMRDCLVGARVGCNVCADMGALLARIAAGSAGAVVIAQEAMDRSGAVALSAALDAQEPWSELPVLLLTPAAAQRVSNPEDTIDLLERANVTLLRRPMSIRMFLSAVRSAVRARGRQYQVRDLHQELRRAVDVSEMFVNVLAHDLRGPLAAIRLGADAIGRTSQDANARRAGRIVHSADRAWQDAWGWRGEPRSWSWERSSSRSRAAARPPCRPSRRGALRRPW